MQQTIILTGPVGVGKTTVGRLAAKILNMPFVDLDDQRERLYAKTDYSETKAELQYALHGIGGWYRYQKPYELHSVERILEESAGSLIAFGAGQSVYETAEQRNAFRALVAPVRHTFLLIPYSGLAESLDFLSKRVANPDEQTLNQILLPQILEQPFAAHTVFVAGKTVQQAADEIVDIVRMNREEA